jgi:hypothetical protein
LTQLTLLVPLVPFLFGNVHITLSQKHTSVQELHTIQTTAKDILPSTGVGLV